VREAADSAAAMVILASGDRVDLLFSDVVMPGAMDGLDLALLAKRARKDLKILLTSGFPGVRAADPRIADCPFPLLNKPYGHDELARAIHDVLVVDYPLPAVAPGGETIHDDHQAAISEAV
jgi:DNA-binding NtrC family response regulator